MRWGIGSYALTWNIGVPGYDRPSAPVTAMGLLELARDCGAALVQYADNLPLSKLADEELTLLAERARQWGISLETGTRGTEPDLLLRELEVARRIGSPFVRTLITDADIGEAERRIREALPAYESSGVALAIENHGLHTTDVLIRLFENLDSPLVGCCLDTVNSFGALEAPDTVIRKLAPYVVNLHLKDFEIKRIDHQLGFVITGTPTGEGRLDVTLLRAELAKHGKRPSTVVELWVPYAGTVDDTCAIEREWLERSIRYMNEQFNGKERA